MLILLKWLTLALTMLFVSANDACRLWMGPSLLSSDANPKLGLFAGVNYSKGELVGQAELALPLIDFIEDWNKQNDVDVATIDFLESLLWMPEYAGAQWESEHSTVLVIPGFGILANYHSGEYNVDWSPSSVLLRELPDKYAGKAHPARGAITTYHNLTIKATKPIQAGMELFANFGQVWDGNGTDVHQDRLVRADYVEADRVIDALIDFMDRYEKQLTPQVADEILEFVTRHVVGTASGQRGKAVRSLIPAHVQKLQKVKNAGGAFRYRNFDLQKSSKWLAKNCICVDNLKSGPSTIAHAGRGAFASRSLKKGHVIAPMPMIQIPNIDIFNLYDYDEEKNAFIMNEPPIGQQLVMNYCFGHVESNMLLLPVGPLTTLINHSPKPNARVEWAPDDKKWGNTDWWLDVHPSELVEEDYRYIGIVMQVVATRDIDEGEEIFIDYGPEWQAAWDEYINMWEKYKANSKWPLKADDMNVLYRNEPFKTKLELKTDPYPNGIKTACFVEWEELPDGRPRVTKGGRDIAGWIGPKEPEDYRGNQMFDCRVLERSAQLENGLWNYTVVGDMQIENVPHAAIIYIDEPYASDMHQAGVFRHPIGVPDDIWPQAWRDTRDDVE